MAKALKLQADGSRLGAFSTGDAPRVGVRFGDMVLDLTATARTAPYADLVAGPTLNPLMAAGRFTA